MATAVPTGISMHFTHVTNQLHMCYQQCDHNGQSLWTYWEQYANDSKKEKCCAHYYYYF